MVIDLAYLELEVGLGRFPLWHPHTTTLKHISATWITSVGKFLHRMKYRVETRTARVLTQQRKNDMFLMQIALDGKFNMKLVQKC